MKLHINLKEIERKIFSFQFENGLVDLLIGTLLSFNAINVILGGSKYMIIPIFSIVIILFTVVNIYVVMPRMGCVILRKSRKRREHIVWIIIAFSILFNVIFEYLTRYGHYAGTRNLLSTQILFATKVMIVLMLIAYFSNFKRLYIYAVLLAITYPTSKILQTENIIPDQRWAFLILGLIIIIIGLVYFVKFIKKYPLQTEEVR